MRPQDGRRHANGSISGNGLFRRGGKIEELHPEVWRVKRKILQRQMEKRVEIDRPLPSGGAVKENEGKNYGQGARLRVFPGIASPHPHHVGQKPQEHQRIRAALVFEEHIDEARAAGNADRDEQIRLGLNVLSVHERCLENFQPFHVQLTHQGPG